MQPFDIVGYTYQADVYHAGCLPITREYVLPFHNREIDVESVERVLDNLTAPAGKLGRWGIDRRDETSFDSSLFPKVLFADQVTPTEICGHCGLTILEYEPLVLCGWNAGGDPASSCDKAAVDDGLCEDHNRAYAALCALPEL